MRWETEVCDVLYLRYIHRNWKRIAMLQGSINLHIKHPTVVTQVTDT